MSRVAVVGGGSVGRRAVRYLTAECPASSVELVGSDSPTDGLEPGDVALLVHPTPHAGLAADLGDRGVSVVSVGDHFDDTRALLDLDDLFDDRGGALVVGAAMSPGLSGLLVRQLANDFPTCDELHVAVHATAGPACARQHHRVLRGRAVGWHDGAWIERPAGSGRELCWFPEPVGARDCYRAELPDPLLLHRSFPDALRISARVSATRRDRLTSRLPMLRAPHPEGGVGAVRVEVRGTAADGSRATAIVGIAEFVGAAAAATAATFTVAALRGDLPSGVVTTSDGSLDTLALLAAIRRRGIRLQEFTGVPQHG